MPLLPASESTTPNATASAGDMFLHVSGIKGESEDAKHMAEIDVLGWSWGMKALMEIGKGQAAGRTALKQLRVLKQVDSASCALMAAAATNKEIPKAVLTVRKAGTEQQEYFKITLEKALISSLDIQVPAPDGSVVPLESVTFAFQKIEVEYKPQGETGSLKGARTFNQDISEGA